MVPSPHPRALRYRSGDSHREEQSGSMGHIQAHDGSIASCRQDGDSQGGKIARYALPELPEEIWYHIHSLLPMRDAARVACVSHAFQSSWRCHPNLIFTDETLCSKENLHKWTGDTNNYKRARREYNNNIDHILAKHRGPGVKTFMLEFHGPCTTKSYNRLNSWIQIAITPVLEKLTLDMFSSKAKYEFPCSLLSDRSGHTIRYLSLLNCVLHPTVNVGLRCLTELDLYGVRITGDELGRLLSNSFALEKLRLVFCSDIIRLEIPFLLQRLSYLDVSNCSSLQVIENKAPNISIFEFAGGEVQLSLGESLQLKNLSLDHRRVINYAIDKLPACVPNYAAPIHIRIGSIRIRKYGILKKRGYEDMF